MCPRYSIFFLHFLLFSIPILHCSASECLDEGSSLTDGADNSTLVSSNNKFELGFFAPDRSNNNRRYLGIYYKYSRLSNDSTPKLIVWVANRDKPLMEPRGSLVIKNGIAMLLDRKNESYWSIQTHVEVGQSVQPVTNRSKVICLSNDGNLVLSRRGLTILWQSFQHPTDTFLPGMDIAQIMVNLISWETQNDPAYGNYKLLLNFDNLGKNKNKMFISEKGSLHYWESDVTPFDSAPQRLFDLLLNNLTENYTDTRLVMKFTGQLQFWEQKNESWSLSWSAPKDSCDLLNRCGYYGSCNSNYRLRCDCLPGFIPSSPKRWNSGNFSEGCLPKSAICSRTYSEDKFLRMPMMKVSTPDGNDTNGASCKSTCLDDCNCKAYSCGAADCTVTSNMCLVWNKDFTNLQEEYANGLTIFVRTTSPDIVSTSRDCFPCGTHTIPYPLSTKADCGDPSYFNFHCNEETGQVSFSASNGTFNVTVINPEARSFSIQVRHGNGCDVRSLGSVVLSPQESMLYSIKNCNVVRKQSLLEVNQSFIEVEMGWKPPPEPPCNVSSDCQDWPHTTCKAKRNGKMRCFCRSTFHWDGRNMRCTKVHYLKVVAPCLAGALAIILICGIFFIVHTRNRRLAEPLGSDKIEGIDTEGIDVPFYDWESILAATNNFEDANKLGTGGFGSVYMGKLPDGQEIAVKRLSSASVQGVEEFKTEVMVIAKLQHRNLVRLTGYCVKADEKILVYEYLHNGSLDSCLFDERHYVDLDWKKRFEIILGIARGLLYLHQDSRLRIIHRDLKPSNILLDEELNPKISDFGIARIVGGKDTQASTGRVVGTYGYMSPEYAYEGIFSVKSDVFSFGVVILETISGRRNSKIFMFEHGLSLLGYAWKLWNEDKGLELMDPKLNESCFPSEVQKCIHIGLLCVQEDPSDRPTMSTVVYMLSGENAFLPLAKQPAFMNRKPLSDNASSSSAKDLSAHEVMTVSTVGR